MSQQFSVFAQLTILTANFAVMQCLILDLTTQIHQEIVIMGLDRTCHAHQFIFSFSFTFLVRFMQ